MKTKQLLALLFVLFSALSVSAQWVKQNVPSTEAPVYYLSTPDKNTLWTWTREASADPANVKKVEYMRTGDGGKTYQKGPLFNSTEGLFMHLEAMNGKKAHLISADPMGNFTFQRTVDGGSTWQMMPYQPTTFPNVVYFWDDNNGILSSDPDNLGMVVMYTTDGGNTFTRLPQTNLPPINPAEEFGIINEFQVIGNTIFMDVFNFVTGEDRYWRSTDRGRNWTSGKSFFSSTIFTPRVAFSDANHGMLLRGINTTTEKPLYTEDGGSTWKEAEGNMPSYTAWPIDNIPGTNTFVALFQDTVRGLLYSASTNDLGKTWNSRKDIVPYQLDSQFVSAGAPPIAFTNMNILSNNAAWGRFTQDDIYRYDSSTPIIPEKPDLDLELKADRDDLPLYGSVKYTLTVKNRGISPATGVKINWLPPYKRTNNGAGAYAYQEAYSDKGHYDSWNGVWSLERIEAGASATATFHLFVLKNNQNVTQTAQVIACNESDLDSAPSNMGVAAIEDDEVGFAAQASTDFSTLPHAAFQSKTPEFMVSPNPAKDRINVFINADTDNSWSIRVLNNVGQVVYTKIGQSNGLVDIDVKGFANGLYLVEYEALGDRKIEKIMVQH
jgi:photosystem II stability/assembly factor-like uncharacterized protein